jgi:radical SAM protein with 4Fe4S-binding SPASM domain
LEGIFEGSGKSPCAKTMCLVTSEGKLRPCNFLPFQTDESLLEKDVYTLWKSPLFEKVRTWQDHIERMCDACEYIKTCRGNCLAFHLSLLSDEEVAAFK